VFAKLANLLGRQLDREVVVLSRDDFKSLSNQTQRFERWNRFVSRWRLLVLRQASGTIRNRDPMLSDYGTIVFFVGRKQERAVGINVAIPGLAGIHRIVRGDGRELNTSEIDRYAIDGNDSTDFGSFLTRIAAQTKGQQAENRND
jgi:hypothetical protein